MPAAAVHATGPAPEVDEVERELAERKAAREKRRRAREERMRKERDDAVTASASLQAAARKPDPFTITTTTISPSCERPSAAPTESSTRSEVKASTSNDHNNSSLLAGTVTSASPTAPYGRESVDDSEESAAPAPTGDTQGDQQLCSSVSLTHDLSAAEGGEHDDGADNNHEAAESEGSDVEELSFEAHSHGCSNEDSEPTGDDEFDHFSDSPAVSDAHSPAPELAEESPSETQAEVEGMRSGAEDAQGVHCNSDHAAAEAPLSLEELQAMLEQVCWCLCLYLHIHGVRALSLYKSSCTE